MNYLTLGSIACLIVAGLLTWWVCRRVDSTQPKDPAEWRKE